MKSEFSNSCRIARQLLCNKWFHIFECELDQKLNLGIDDCYRVGENMQRIRKLKMGKWSVFQKDEERYYKTYISKVKLCQK